MFYFHTLQSFHMNQYYIFGGMDCGNWVKNQISLRSLLLLLGWCCVLASIPKPLFILSSGFLLQFTRSSPFLRTFCYFTKNLISSMYDEKRRSGKKCYLCLYRSKRIQEVEQQLISWKNIVTSNMYFETLMMTAGKWVALNEMLMFTLNVFADRTCNVNALFTVNGIR